MDFDDFSRVFLSIQSLHPFELLLFLSDLVSQFLEILLLDLTLLKVAFLLQSPELGNEDSHLILIYLPRLVFVNDFEHFVEVILADLWAFVSKLLHEVYGELISLQEV